MQHVIATPETVPGVFAFCAHAFYTSGVQYSRTDINDWFVFPVREAFETAARNKLVHALLEDDGTPVGIIAGFTGTMKYDDPRFVPLINHVYEIVGDSTFIVPVFAVDPRVDQRSVCEELVCGLYTAIASFRGYFTTLVYVSSKENRALQALYEKVFAADLVDTLRVENSSRTHRDLSFYRGYID